METSGFTLIVFLISVIHLDLIAAEGKCAHGTSFFSCAKYVDNYDGDTIKSNIPSVPKLIGTKMPIRVKGVDTAELKSKNKCEKKMARIAKKLVKNVLSRSKRIDLKNCTRGKYFRFVCDVIYDNKNLSKMLADQGLAYKYSGKTKSKVDWCSRLPASLKSSK